MRPPNSLVASVVALILVALTAGLLILSFRARATLVESNNITDRAVETGDEISGLLAGQVDSILGFQAEGGPQYNEAYRTQQTNINNRMRALKSLTASMDPTVQVFFKELQSAIDDWHQAIDKQDLVTRRLPPVEFRTLAFQTLFAMRRAQAASIGFNEVVLAIQIDQNARLQKLAYLFTALAVISGPVGVSALVFLTYVLRQLNTAKSHLEKRASEEQHLRQTEEALRHVGDSLTGCLTVNDVLRRTLEGVALVTPADDVCIETVDPRRNETMCAAVRGSDVPTIGTTTPYKGSLAEEVLQSGQPRIIENMDVEGQRASILRGVRRSDGRSAMIIPLVAQNRPLGTIAVLRGAPNGFTYADTPNLQILGEMASIALHRAQTVETLERLEHEEHFLAEAWRTLASSLEYQRTLRTVARLPLPRIGDWCILHLIEGQRIYHAEVAAADPAHDGVAAELLRAAHRERPDLSVSIESAVRTRRALLVRDVSDDYLKDHTMDGDFELMRGLDPKSLMIVPLTVVHETLGALLFFTTGGRRYGDEDLRLARKFARIAARAIANAQLYAVANAAIQSRDDVFRAVAHDLRNPLNAINVSADLLADGSVPYERQQKLLRSITGASQRMNRLVEDLLTIGRLHAGQTLPLVLHRENPADIVEHACEIIGPQADKKSVALRWSKPWMPMHSVFVDRSRLLQALTNLLDNALKFTPPGGSITVSCEESAGEMRFAVSDTGRGINPADLDRIFDPFWQARGSAHLGAGLGLAIVKAIVEQHHGRIGVESKLGVGTTVTFVLPVAGTGEAKAA
ncbi:MAG TPA: ATP-binding protein [Vicinamibacterales bacterium]